MTFYYYGTIVMKTRLLANDLQVSSIGFGAMGLSEFYGDVDDNQSLTVLNELLNLDMNFIEPSWFYRRQVCLSQAA